MAEQKKTVVVYTYTVTYGSAHQEEVGNKIMNDLVHYVRPMLKSYHKDNDMIYEVEKLAK